MFHARSVLLASALSWVAAPEARAQDDLNQSPVVLATLLGGGSIMVVDGVTFGPAVSAGLRMELARWAPYVEIDGGAGLVAPIGSLRLGAEAGLHHVLFAEKQSPYFGLGLGASYQGSDVGYWTGSDNPTAVTGGGFEVRLTGGYEFLRHRRDSRLMVQSELMLPAYLLKEADPNGRRAWAPAFVISVGGAYIPRRW